MVKRLKAQINTRTQGPNEIINAILGVLKVNNLYSLGDRYRALSMDDKILTRILSIGTDRIEEEHKESALELFNRREGSIGMDEATILTDPRYTWTSTEEKVVRDSLNLYRPSEGRMGILVYDGTRLVMPEATDFPEIPGYSREHLQFIHGFSGFRKFIGQPMEALKALIEIENLR